MSEHDKLCERPVTAKKYVKEWLNDGAQIAHLAAGIAETRWCRCAERLCCLCVFKGLTPPEATVIRERHQAEAAKAIWDLRSALTAAAVELHFQHRVGISSMIECLEARCQEWCALLDRTSSGSIQRAREGT